MLILDGDAQRRIAGLIARAAERPLSRLAVERRIALRRRGDRVGLDTSLMVMIAEDYLVAFGFEMAPEFGVARHLAVSRSKREAEPDWIAAGALMGEFGMTGRISDHPAWFEPVPGRGRALHVIEPVTVWNSSRLAPELLALIANESLAPGPDELVMEDEQAA